MSEYIRKEDVLNLPQSIERNLRGEVVERSIDVGAIESLEPADVAPVVHGRWIDADFCGQYECSECGNNAVDLYDYCPYCGAKMDGEE